MKDDQFAAVIRSARAAPGMTDAELAALLGVSKTTVVRWATNETAPHPSMRKAVYAKLKARPLHGTGGVW